MERINGYEGRTIWNINREEAERMLHGGANKLYTLHEIYDRGWFYQNSKDIKNGRIAGEFREKFSFLIEEIFPCVYVPFFSEGEIASTYPANITYIFVSLVIRRIFLIDLLCEFFGEDQGEELAREYLEDGGFGKMAVSDGNTTLGLDDWVDYVSSTDRWENQICSYDGKCRYATTTEGKEVIYCRSN